MNKDLEIKLSTLKKREKESIKSLKETIDERSQSLEEKTNYIHDLTNEISLLKKKLQDALTIEKEQVLALITKLILLLK